MRALTAGRLAKDSIQFARWFEGWEAHDPGPEARAAITNAYIDRDKTIKAFLADPTVNTVP